MPQHVGRRWIASLIAVLVGGLLTVSPSGASEGSQPEAQVEPQVSEVRYGPIFVPPASEARAGQASIFTPYAPMPCTNCYLTGAEIDMVFEDGRSANLDSGVMLHHMVVFNTGRPDATCAPDTAVGSLGERFFAAGNERTAGHLPEGFGYHLGTDRVQAVVEIMNHTTEPQTVYLATKASHVPDSTKGMKAVTPIWMDENNCGSSTYSVPAGESNKVATWTSDRTGRFVFAGGHVHDGGLRTVLANESTGEQMCTSYAGYGTNPAYMGTVESMTTCGHDRIGVVREGEKLSLDTYYDSPVAQDDVMGIMLAYLHETDDLNGGTPASPQSRPANNTPPDTLPSHGGHGGHH
ncbi:MAG: hypothetical protein ACRDY7_04040 [Acidimicrobiia bacterium]